MCLRGADIPTGNMHRDRVAGARKKKRSFGH
jgi:hypothetical protein